MSTTKTKQQQIADYLSIRARWRMTLSPATADTYQRRLRAMAGKRPEQHTRKKGAFKVYRAAYVLGLLDQLHALQRQPGGVRALEESRILTELDRYPPGKGRTPLTDGSKSRLTNPKPVDPHSRRLRRLPADWQSTMWQACRTATQRLRIAVLTLTGCRPAEFAEGVGIEVSDGKLMFTVRGRKVKTRGVAGSTYNAGQPERTLTVSAGTPEAACIFEALRGKRSMVVRCETKQLRKLVAAVAARAFPNRRIRPSPYTYRNAFAEVAKVRSKGDKTTVAKAMGHSSTATQTHYGRQRVAGVRKLGLVSVSAKRAPAVSQANNLQRLRKYKAAKAAQRSRGPGSTPTKRKT